MDTSSADYKRYQAWLAANPPPPTPAPRPAPGPPPKTIDQCLVEFQKCDRPHRINPPPAPSSVRPAPAPVPSSVLPAPAPAPMFALSPSPSPASLNMAPLSSPAPSSSSMSIGGYSWMPYLSKDYPTSAMQYLPNKTLTQCAQACATTSGCKGFATGAAVSPTVAGDCSLKNAWTPSGLTPNTNLNAYQYLPSGVPPAPVSVVAQAVTQGVATPGQSGLMNIAGYNYQSYLRTDYPSSAMQYLPNKTLTQCAQACATTSGCKGFATGAAVSPTVAGDCSLKNAWTPSGLTPNTNLNAYQYLPSGTQGASTATGSINISGSNWMPYLSKDYPGSEFKHLTGQTLTQCAQTCATTSGCKGFSAGASVSNTVAGECSLKNAWTPTGLTPNTNLNAYQYLGASGTSGYAMEGSYLGGLVSSKRDWTLIMILFVLVALLWIIAKKM